MAHDIAAIISAWWLAHLFRFNFDIPPSHLSYLQSALPWVALTQFASFQLFGLYRGQWKYASLPYLRRILLAVLVGAAALLLVLPLLQLFAGMPRSVLLLDPILLLLIMSGSRLTYRMWQEGHLFGLRSSQGKPVLVLGAGATAVGLVKELARSKEWRVVGLLDDDPQKQRMILHDLAVLGRIDQLPAISRKQGITNAIIAMPFASTATAAGPWRYVLPLE